MADHEKEEYFEDGEEEEEEEEEDVEIVLDDAGDLEAALEGEDKRDAIQLKPKEQPQTAAADEGEEKPPMDEVIPLRAGEININGIGEFNSQQILDVDLDDGDKPWRKPGADITDYFNYGFNEKTWRAYCLKQKQLREDIKRLGEEGGTPGGNQSHQHRHYPHQQDRQNYQQQQEQHQQNPERFDDDYRRQRHGGSGGGRWRDDRGSVEGGGGRQTPSDYGGDRRDHHKRYRDRSVDSGGDRDRTSSSHHRYKNRRMH